MTQLEAFKETDILTKMGCQVSTTQIGKDIWDVNINSYSTTDRIVYAIRQLTKAIENTNKPLSKRIGKRK